MSSIADALGQPFAAILTQTDRKRSNRPPYALRQAPFICSLPKPGPTRVVIADDLITTRRTMRLSVGAIRAAGVAAFGFGFSGVRCHEPTRARVGGNLAPGRRIRDTRLVERAIGEDRPIPRAIRRPLIERLYEKL